MDKAEFKERISRITEYLDNGEQEEALDLLDSINWRKLHNVNLLLDGAALYERAQKLYDAKELLEIAHDRSPIGRMIIYHLANVCASLGEIEEAKIYYQKFIELAPGDNLRFIIKYNINKAQNADEGVLITILEDLKANELIEEWAFELAQLYRKTNQIDKCLTVLDELILWYGDGPYVEKAYELKMLYKPLTKDQADRYREMTSASSNVTEIRPGDTKVSGTEILGHTIRIPEIEETNEKYNTQNLQAEIRKNIEEIMKASEVNEVSDNINAIKGLVEYIPYFQEEEPENILEEKKEEAKKVGQTLKNRFREYLSEEYDGQISLNFSNIPQEDKPIPGQLTIQEVMAGWEKTSRAAAAALSDAKEHELLAYKQKAIAKASDVLGKLQDMESLPGARTFPIPKVELSGADRGVGFEIPIISQEEVRKKALDLKKTATFITEPVKEIATGAVAEPVYELANESLTEGLKDELAAILNEETAEQVTAFDEYYELADESLTESLAAEIKAVLDEEIKETAVEIDERYELADESLTESLGAEIKVILGETAAESIGKIDKYYELADESLTDDLGDELRVILDEDASRAVEREILEELPDESLTRYLVADFIYQPVAEKQDAISKDQQISLNLPTEETSLQEAQIMLGDINNMLQKEIDRLMKESDYLPSEQQEETVVPETKPIVPETVQYTDSQKALLTYFADIREMQEDIIETIKGVERELANGGKHSAGNIAITGREGCGKTKLAVNLVKIFQEEIGVPKGQIGRIAGDKLNEKDLIALFNRIKGGTLIVEGAGVLNRSTTADMCLVMDNDNTGVLVVLEDSAENMADLFRRDRQFANKFSERIHIPVMKIDDLVGFGKFYAAECGYAIDEMGVLALYDSISLVDRPDRPAEIKDVKQIVDRAILKFKNTKKGIFDLLSNKSSSDNNGSLLQEKHFRED